MIQNDKKNSINNFNQSIIKTKTNISKKPKKTFQQIQKESSEMTSKEDNTTHFTHGELTNTILFKQQKEKHLSFF